MTRGKNICKQLKEVRKRIAEENDIPLEIEECTYKGECRGTCPRCEAEVRYLESALADRLRLGKVATVAGLALGLAATAQAQAPQTDSVPLQDTTKAHKAECLGTLKGMVFDMKTNEPLPFCSVVLMQDGKQILVGSTDFDGRYTIKPIPFGDYTLCIKSPERKQPFEQGIAINKTGFTVMDVGMDLDSAMVIDGGQKPVIDIGMPSSVEEIIEQMGQDGKARIPRDTPGEIQVKLPGTPANQSTPKEHPTFYEEKEQQGARVKVLSIAALALGLTATTVQAAEACPAVLPEVPPIVKEAVQKKENITLHGTVIDDKTEEPMPFVNVVFKKGKKTIATATTNWEGVFDIVLPKGDYSIEVRSLGYLSYTLDEAHYDSDTTILPIRLVVNPDIKLESIEINAQMIGILDPEQFEANPSWQKFEKNGVQVIVR